MIENEIQQFQNIYEYMINFLLEYSFQLFGALIILILGVVVARKVAMLVLSICDNNHIDITLATFISNVFKVSIIVLVGMIALGKVGVSITPFVAAVGALSLGAGLALQGVLSNYGAGFTIILSRHFKVGDTIKVKNITGVVKEIRLSHTFLINEDDEEILVPNRHIVGEVLHNSFQYTLVEGSVGISYDSDVEAAIALVRSTLSDLEGLAKKPIPQVGIQCFAESAIEIGYRYQAPTAQLFQMQYQANLHVFLALKNAGITLPFPQRDVHVKVEPSVLQAKQAKEKQPNV